MDNIELKLFLMGLIIVICIFAAILGRISYKLVKKNYKFYSLCNLIIYLYPYIYLFVIAAALYIENGEIVVSGILVAMVIHPLIISLLVSDAVINKHQIMPAKNIATINMCIKLAHIPVFILHFIVGIISFLLSVWGIGFLIAVVVIDLFTIIISGTHSVFTIESLYKQKKISRVTAIVCGICSYIYCVDVITVIYLNARVRAQS